MTYKCKNSFISNYGGKHYVVGSEIGDREYNNLALHEKLNFTQVLIAGYANESSGIASGEVNSGMHGLSEDSQSLYDYENDSPPSQDSYSPPDNSDFSFGGGDTGGAGASDDY